MNETLRKQMEEMAIEHEAICYCAGPTCSGCGPTTRKIFFAGFAACSEIYEAKLEEFCISIDCNTIGLSMDQVEKIKRAVIANFKELE